jgi:hypothetical protein
MQRLLWSLAILAAVAVGVPAARGEEPPRRRVVAGKRYQAGAIHRALFGADYRDLWAMPVEVTVLDLQHYAGGLRPVRRVGGQETKGLALKGADGRDYTFRGLDKDPSEVLPPELRESVARSIVQDQIASSHPAGSVVVASLLDAAGVLHSPSELVVMPDDPALGEFRPVFANLVGTIELYPRPVGGGNPGFEGATEVIYGDELWKRLQASPADRIDARAFLEARLFDVFIGDWDRHRGQWRWAKVPSSPLWQPIPEDRDQAFVRFEGLFLSMFRKGQPRLVVFGPKYSPIAGVTFNGWEVDRRLLTELDRSAWDEMARDLRGRLTDAVLQAAVARMPAEYRASDGARLLAGLKARRDAMTEEAVVYYRHLAGKVDVYATDRADRVELTGLAGGALDVKVSEAAAGSTPYYHRTLLPGDTEEVRVHLGAGDDRVIAQGPSSPITVRVIGDAGCEAVEVTGGPEVRVSDTESCTTVTGHASLDRRVYVPPPANPRAPWIPPRDWGGLTTSLPWLSYGPDLGLFLGASVTRESYGFRKDPYASHQRLRGGYATTAQAVRFDYQGDFRHENSGTRTSIFARASGIEILRFYGLGNETVRLPSDDAHKVKQQQYLFAPALVFDLGSRADLTVGPVVQYSTTSLEAGRLIGAVQPYGTEDFGQVGGRLGLSLDHRDRPGYPTRGALVHAEARAFPGVWGVRSTFGELHGEASAYLTPAVAPHPTLALRVGGKRVWGDYPFHEAAYIGGHTTVRGFRAERFGGDASLYGNAELRLALGRFFVLLPGEFGIFGLADAGRVFLEGESSNKWHTAAGGGVWFSFLSRRNTLSIAVATSEERTGLYVDAGFMF